MRKARKFIQDCTKTFSNEIEQNVDDFSYFVPVPWLNPDEARKAVEIAEKEMMERACNAYCKVCGHYAHSVPTHICRHDCRYFSDFRKYMKGE